MSIRRYRLAMRLLLAPIFFVILPAHAEPYLAVQTGFKCGQCHVNPTGGGERNAFGNAFAQTQLPARRIDTGPDTWTGEVTKFLSLGGDLRFDASYTQIPHSPSVNQFDLEQARVYLDASPIPQRLSVYVDEQVAPGGALNREALYVYSAGTFIEQPRSVEPVRPQLSCTADRPERRAAPAPRRAG